MASGSDDSALKDQRLGLEQGAPSSQSWRYYQAEYERAVREFRRNRRKSQAQTADAPQQSLVGPEEKSS